MKGKLLHITPGARKRCSINDEPEFEIKLFYFIIKKMDTC